MGKKTFSVEKMRLDINSSLKNSTSDYCSKDVRQGLCNALEYVLHTSGNYHGFKYLWQDAVPQGELPGIVVHGLIETTPQEVRFAKGTVDETRREYF
jgi:hypothetical protein